MARGRSGCRSPDAMGAGHFVCGNCLMCGLGEDAGMSLEALRGRLIVSCQADPEDAFYGRMDLYAKAAADGGAAGIRANGPADVRAIREAVALPVLGIQ